MENQTFFDTELEDEDYIALLKQRRKNHWLLSLQTAAATTPLLIPFMFWKMAQYVRSVLGHYPRYPYDSCSQYSLLSQYEQWVGVMCLVCFASMLLWLVLLIVLLLRQTGKRIFLLGY